MKITIREKKINNGRISLYLDIYTPSEKTKRFKEFLGLYIIKAHTPLETKTNKETRKLAETIRAKRQIEIQNGTYGVNNNIGQDCNFLEYFKMLVEERKGSKGNYGNWDSTLKHLEKYANGQIITFADVNEQWIEGFKKYLSGILSQNSGYSYFNKFKASLSRAFEDKVINENPSKRIKGIKQAESNREYLILEELQKLSKTDCEIPILKTAFLFSALTGLRWSDIQKLTWSEIKVSNEGTCSIQFRQQKTKGMEYLPIANQARAILGEPQAMDERVFKGLKYSAWHNLRLAQWVMKAGITKNITFHCARHSFATLQLSLGTDIYTVSKLLGHRELKTTQVYAKIIDRKKDEAVNNIPEINLM